jgi:hypothetical protein
VFAVAVTLAIIMIAFVTVAAFELEILDLCRILVVANPRPNRSDERLRYLPATPRVCGHLYGKLSLIGGGVHVEYGEVIFVALRQFNVLNGIFLLLIGIVEVECL